MSDSENRETAERFGGFEALPLEVTVRVGEARCTLGRLAGLEPGEVIFLDRRIGEPFDLMAGEVLLGHVEPVAAEDGVAVKLVGIAEEDDDPSS